jgi:ABC-2 type transport system permease protein
MTSTASEQSIRVSTSRVGLLARLVEIWRYRELLVAFSRTALKVKYKNSVLGFAWSMLNPAMYLVVYYVVFDLILGSGIPHFGIFLLSGILVWNLFATSLGGATGSVVANAGLVRKVAFPREILPLAAVGAALVHFFLQSIVLVIALLIFVWPVAWSYLPLLPVALFALLFFVAALGVLLGSINVYLRDTAHFVELILIAWFFMTPIVYPYETVAAKLGAQSWVFLLNPITDIVITFQRAIYGKTEGVKTTNGVTAVTKILPAGADQWWYLWHLGLIILASVVLTVIALTVFGRAEGNFAEEL